MENFESLKRKIKATHELQSVVRTMKSLAAVNLRQYERALQSLDEYRKTVARGLRVVLQRQASPAQPAGPPRDRHAGVIVFGSDQGLCGPFNERIAAHAVADLRRKLERPQDATVLAVGQRTVPRLEAAGYRVERCLPVPVSASGAGPLIQELLLHVDHWNRRLDMQRIVLFHNMPVSGASFLPCSSELLPLDLSWIWVDDPSPSRTLPSFTLEPRELFAALVREHLFAALYRAFVASISSENASRLAAMQAADRNIDDALRELRLRFHHQRQTAVTVELLDITTGFEALSRTEIAGPA